MQKLNKTRNSLYLFRRCARIDTAGPSNARYMRIIAQSASRNEQAPSATVTLNYCLKNESSATGSIARDDGYVRSVKTMVRDNIEIYRRKVQGFAYLPRSWDTHGAGPISLKAIADSLRLLDLLEKNHIVPNAAIPTSDESVLIRYESGLKTFKWEFAGNGEIAFVKTEADGKREYVDVPSNFTELPV